MSIPGRMIDVLKTSMLALEQELLGVASSALSLEHGNTPRDSRCDRFSLACPRCGVNLGPGELMSDCCKSCISMKSVISRTCRLGCYQPPLSDFIRQIKYSADREMASRLGRLLARQVQKQGVRSTD